MKKIICLWAVLFFTVFALNAQNEKSLSDEIRNCINEISQVYAERYPDLAVKKGAAILPFKENGEDVVNNKLGILIETYLEEEMENSIVFFLVDRKNLEKILEEQKFSLSGLTGEGTGPEIGEISGVDVFLSGEIVRDGVNFKVSVRLTDSTTSEIMDVYSFYIPDQQMIDASLDLQYSYVAPNGIGISFGMNYLITPPANFTKETILKLIMDLSVKYRLSKDFMIEAGVWMPVVSKTDNYYVYPGDLTYGDLQPELTGLPAAESASLAAAVQSIMVPHIDVQYTLNFIPEFNIGFKLGWVTCQDPVVRLSTRPYHSITAYDNTGASTTESIVQEEEGIDIVYGHMFGGRVEIAPELFITPRIAVNGVIGYIYTFPIEVWEVRIGTKHFEPSDYFGYDPTKMPDGTPWFFDLSSFYGGFSVSVFF